MTRRRWRQLGLVGAVFATASVVPLIVSTRQEFHLDVRVRDIPSPDYPNRIVRRQGLHLTVTAGATYFRFAWWEEWGQQPVSFRFLANPQSPRNALRLFGGESYLTVGLLYPFATGLCLWIIGRRRGKELKPGFEVQSVENT